MEGSYTHKFYVFVNVLEGRGGGMNGGLGRDCLCHDKIYL